MSEIRDWVNDNLKDARELIDSGVEGAKSAIKRADAHVDLAESTRASWKATVLGATVGVVVGILGGGKRSRGALLGGVVGGTVGLIAGLAWENHEALGTALHGAGESMSAKRDSQWLSRHPIDYA